MLRVFSGIQPTADSLHLGNYLGAVKNWVDLQNNYECIYSIVDLHSLTVNPDPKILRERVYKTAAQLLASGIDEKKSILFVQSDVIEHSALTWLLSNKTAYGELKRMTQFKDKSSKSDILTAGLFIYPILMTADILLYNTDVVPVGVDQKQHLELSVKIASRINSSFGKNTVNVPKPLISKFPKILDLQNPENKMSKSEDSDNGIINLLDDDSKIVKKIKSAVTDSKNVIKYDEKNQPGLANLLKIYSGLSGFSVDEIVQKYNGKMYGHIKQDLSELVKERIGTIRNKALEILDDKKYLDSVLLEGANKASKIATKNYNVLDKLFSGK